MKIQDSILTVAFFTLLFFGINIFMFRLFESNDDSGILKFMNNGLAFLMLILYLIVMYFIPNKSKSFVYAYLLALILSLIFTVVAI